MEAGSVKTEESRTGRIIRSLGGFYYVDVPGEGVFECRAKGLFRNENTKPLVGDMVRLHEVVDTDIERPGSIDEVLPRESELIRPAIANASQVIVIFAAVDPKPNLGLLDRFLCEMERQGARSLVCFNKIDLAAEDELASLRSIYERAGYRVVLISARRGEIQELTPHLEGKISVLAGPSGAGKSTLVNLLQSGMKMETGTISKKLGRGRHTTRRSELLALDGMADSYIVDTPGFSSIELKEEDELDVAKRFPEFAGYADKCRFALCSHIKEESCAVKEAVEKGAIAPQRYESYVSFYDTVRSERRRSF